MSESYRKEGTIAANETADAALLNAYTPKDVVLVENGTEPKTLNLREILYYYLEHQKEVITRRTRYDLNKTEERAHIVAGLVLALANVDEVIRIIRSAYDDARERLCERFGLDEVQAQAIVQMRLGQLTGLERTKIEEELAALKIKIAEFMEILADEKGRPVVRLHGGAAQLVGQQRHEGRVTCQAGGLVQIGLGVLPLDELFINIKLQQLVIDIHNLYLIIHPVRS